MKTALIALELCSHPDVRYDPHAGVYRCPDCRHFHRPDDDTWIAERPARPPAPVPDCDHQHTVRIVNGLMRRCNDCGMVEGLDLQWRVP